MPISCVQGRLVMELHAMMAYGASAPSVQLLWRLGLLDIILPQHAAYLVSQGYELGCASCCGLIHCSSSPQRPLMLPAWCPRL